MKTSGNRGSSSFPHSFHFRGFAQIPARYGRIKAEKLTGRLELARCELGGSRLHCSSPSVREYRPPLAFSIKTGRRGADGSAFWGVEQCIGAGRACFRPSHARAN